MYMLAAIVARLHTICSNFTTSTDNVCLLSSCECLRLTMESSRRCCLATCSQSNPSKAMTSSLCKSRHCSPDYHLPEGILIMHVYLNEQELPSSLPNFLLPPPSLPPSFPPALKFYQDVRQVMRWSKSTSFNVSSYPSSPPSAPPVDILPRRGRS